MTYEPLKLLSTMVLEEIYIYKKVHYLTQNVAQHPLHHVTYMYPGTKFEVGTSNGLGGDTFTRKYII